MPLRPLLLIPLCLAWSLLGPPRAQALTIEQARQTVVRETLAYLNTPYLWGGQHPVTGMDCSAFVRQVYSDATLTLPRTSRQQFASTQPVGPRDVRPGDLVFFAIKNPGTREVDHVGIYVGRGYFIAASVQNGVHIESIRAPYYWARLIGVRRYKGF